MIVDEMRLRSLDFFDCLSVASLTLAAIDDAPAFADGMGNLLGGRRWIVCGAIVSFDPKGSATRIEDVRAEGNKHRLALRGVAARVPVEDDGTIGDHPQKVAFAGDAKARRKSVSMTAGVLAHEGSHALQNRSSSFNEQIWDEARCASDAAAAQPLRPAYEAYVANPYELAAHASQAVAELLVNYGREIFESADAMENRFRTLWVIRRVATWPDEPIEKPAAGPLIDLLFDEVTKVVEVAGLRQANPR